MAALNARSVLLCLLFVCQWGCATARYVSVDRSGGIVAIPENSNRWPSYNRQKADALMSEKFPGGYVIEHEEEVVVGTTEHTETQTSRTGDPLLAALRIAPVQEQTHNNTTYVDHKEWRIWFRDAKAAPRGGRSAAEAAAGSSAPPKLAAPPRTGPEEPMLPGEPIAVTESPAN